jgi:hypothetical protein
VSSCRGKSHTFTMMSFLYKKQCHLKHKDVTKVTVSTGRKRKAVKSVNNKYKKNIPIQIKYAFCITVLYLSKQIIHFAYSAAFSNYVTLFSHSAQIHTCDSYKDQFLIFYLISICYCYYFHMLCVLFVITV